MSNFPEIPSLDPRSEDDLTQLAKLTAFNRSGGALNELSQNSFTDLTCRSLAVVGSELLYYANKLPWAFALNFLQMTGEKQTSGTKATVQLTFTLSTVRSIPYRIPQGYEVVGRYKNTTFSFYTDAPCDIPPGVRTGTISATAKETGEAYNLPAGAITQLSQPLAYLQSVANGTPASGGTDPETEDDFIGRALRSLRRRNPVSASDFEEECREILGAGVYAKAIGLLDATMANYVPGVVHVFILNKDGFPANPAQLNKVYQSLLPRMQLGTTLYTSPMPLFDIHGEVTCQFDYKFNPLAMAEALWATYQRILRPTNIKAGEAVRVNELEYEFRFIEGIRYVERLDLNGFSLDVGVPNEYTIASPATLAVNLVNKDGQVFSYAFALQPDPD